MASDGKQVASHAGNRLRPVFIGFPQIEGEEVDVGLHLSEGIRVGISDTHRAANNSHLRVGEARHQLPDGVLGENAVGIDHEDDVGIGHVGRTNQGTGFSHVLRISPGDHSAWEIDGRFLKPLPTVVPGAVIGSDDLKFVHRIVAFKNGSDGVVDIWPFVKAGEQDADRWFE